MKLAYINIINPNDGKTALDYAIENDHKDIIKLLRDNGAKTASEINDNVTYH